MTRKSWLENMSNGQKFRNPASQLFQSDDSGIALRTWLGLAVCQWFGMCCFVLLIPTLGCWHGFRTKSFKSCCSARFTRPGKPGPWPSNQYKPNIMLIFRKRELVSSQKIWIWRRLKPVRDSGIWYTFFRDVWYWMLRQNGPGTSVKWKWTLFQSHWIAHLLHVGSVGIWIFIHYMTHFSHHLPNWQSVANGPNLVTQDSTIIDTVGTCNVHQDQSPITGSWWPNGFALGSALTNLRVFRSCSSSLVALF